MGLHIGSIAPDFTQDSTEGPIHFHEWLGKSWGVSASYLGSHSDRLWAQTALNPGIFMGLGPCTIQGVSYTVCTTNANLNQRRKLFQINPTEAGKIGALDLNSDVGFQKYRGLKLSAQRRGTGVSINGSYTLSRCFGTTTTTAFNQTSSGYLKPNDPSFDAGPCDQDRTHLGTLTTGYQTPQAGAGVLEVPKAELARIEEFTIPARDGHAMPARLYAPSAQVSLMIARAPEAGWMISWALSLRSRHFFMLRCIP